MKLLSVIAISIAMSAVAADLETESVVNVCMKPAGHELLVAQSLASAAFARIGVKLKWIFDQECLDKHVFVAFGTQTPPDFHPGTLAYAVPEASHITVFSDRIFNRDQGIVATVLSHVLVHEIAHVLQGVVHHSETGVMKAQWERMDFSEMMFKPLVFTADDVDLIHRGLSRRNTLQAASNQTK